MAELLAGVLELYNINVFVGSDALYIFHLASGLKWHVPTLMIFTFVCTIKYCISMFLALYALKVLLGAT